MEFELHEVYGVDVYVSSGDGKSREKDVRTTVYKKSEQTYALKMKASRSKIAFFQIQKLYLTLFDPGGGDWWWFPQSKIKKM